MAQFSIKKISVGQLKSGMYIHDLNCDWMDHPFVRKQFKVSSQNEIEKIFETGILSLYIDASKGLDVKEAPTQEQVQQNIEREIASIASVQTPVQIKTTQREELLAARRIKNKAQEQVRKMMSDVRLGKALKVEAADYLVQDVTESILRNSSTLTSLLRIKNKDSYTFQHSVSVCALMIAFCRSAGMEQELVHQAGLGGLLHDIGKSMISDEILNKPDKLTNEEFENVKQHSQIGYKILTETPGIGDIPLDIALHHHERTNGKGYPDKARGGEISKLAQMAAIVDVYDAITSERSYHAALTAAEGLRRIYEWSEHHFSPVHVHAFIRCIGIYPVGTLVKMESDHLAVVEELNENSLLTPKVKLFFDTKSESYITPKSIDLSRPFGFGGGDKILNYENSEKWNVNPMQILGMA